MRSRIPVTLVAASILVLLPALACQQHDTGTSALRSQTRDSAGIQVVENPAPPPGSRLEWRIGSEPSVSIGRREGEDPYLLSPRHVMPRYWPTGASWWRMAVRAN